MAAMKVQGGRMVPVNTTKASKAINAITTAERAVNQSLKDVADAGSGIPANPNDGISKAMRAIETAYGNLQTAKQAMIRMQSEANMAR